MISCGKYEQGKIRAGLNVTWMIFTLTLYSCTLKGGRDRRKEETFMDQTQTDNLKVLTALGEKKRLNKADIEQALSICRATLNSDVPPLVEVITAIVNMNFAIIPPFTEEIFLSLKPSVQHKALEVFLGSDKIVSNIQCYGIRRNVLMATSLLDSDVNDVFIHGLLRMATIQYEEKGSNPKVNEIFLGKMKTLFSLDYSIWSHDELVVFLRWMEEVAVTAEDKKSVSEFVQKWRTDRNKAPKSEESLDKPAVVTKELHSKSEPQRTPTLQEQGEGLIRQLREVLIQLQRDAQHYEKKNDQTRADLERLKYEYSILESYIEELELDKHFLQDSITKLEMQVQTLSTENGQLNERLENVLLADQNQAKFELEAFRSDLSKRLGPDYKDFLHLSNVEPTPTYFEALLGVLDGVFDTLRRKGIRFPEGVGG